MTAPLFDGTTKRAFVVAGGVVLIATGFLLYVRHKRQEEADAIRAASKQFERGGLIACPGPPDDSWIRSEESGREGTRHRDRIADVYRAAFIAAKNAVENSATRSTEELIKTKRKIGEIESVAEQYDPEGPQQIKDWKVRLDQLLVVKMRDEANAFAALPTTTPHAGLSKYGESEDYVIKAVLDAKKAKNAADEASFTETYKALLVESDAFAAKVITPEFIDAVPWKDLLSGELATRWSKTTTVPGFACLIDDGVMTVRGPDAGSKQPGVAGIFDQKTDNLRHFVLDIEFTVEGTVTMFFHVSPAPENPDDRQSHTFELDASNAALASGRKSGLGARYIGGDLAFEFPTWSGRWHADPSWTKLRKGGIAFVVPEGARLKVTRMRIKELR